MAPRKMAKMNAAVRVVCCMEEFSTFRFSRPDISASRRAPRAPTPEASVGVAMPAKMEPSTPRINAAVGTTAFATSQTMAQLTFSVPSGTGAMFGCSIGRIIA